MFRVAASTLGHLSLEAFARSYEYGGWEYEPVQDELPPREIVRRLHREIAAKSPEHAALVAEYERYRSRPVTPGGRDEVNRQRKAERIERMRKYAQLLASGLSRKEAARALGIGERKTYDYDADMHLVTGGGHD